MNTRKHLPAIARLRLIHVKSRPDLAVNNQHVHYSDVLIAYGNICEQLREDETDYERYTFIVCRDGGGGGRYPNG